MSASLRLVPPPVEAAHPNLEFDDLFRTYAAFVARIGVRLLGNLAEVDDLVQDVFIDAMRGLQSLQNRAALKGWLATIAVRHARRRLRRRRLRTFLHLDHELDVQFHGVGPETQAMLAQLYSQLDRLPTNQRLAWTLRYLEEHPLEMVAAMCECSLATAKRRIAAATRALAGTPLATHGRSDDAPEEPHA